MPSLPPPGTTVRGLLAHEVRGECVLGDLSRLGLFRCQLRAVASGTSRSLKELKRGRMDILPSRIIEDAIRVHGQPREGQLDNDVYDRHLADFAAYCDVLYVDKCTSDAFRRAMHKEPRLKGHVGEIAKAADFDAFFGHS
ncbi:hypothetical protein [Xanthobacter sediminis]